VGQGPEKEITHFPIVGIISVTCVLVCIWLVRFLKPAAHETDGAPDFLDQV
jgi:hypothetical protein